MSLSNIENKRLLSKMMLYRNNEIMNEINSKQVLSVRDWLVEWFAYTNSALVHQCVNKIPTIQITCRYDNMFSLYFAPRENTIWTDNYSMRPIVICWRALPIRDVKTGQRLNKYKFHYIYKLNIVISCWTNFLQTFGFYLFFIS